MDGQYDDAADQLEAGGEADSPDPKDAGREDTFFLPADFPGAETFKPGDPLNLRVVGKDAEGGIEVEPMPMGDKGEPPWKRDLRKSVPTVPGGGGIGNEPESEM